MTMNTAAHISDAAAPDDLYASVPFSLVRGESAHALVEMFNDHVEKIEGLLRTARLVQSIVVQHANEGLTCEQLVALFNLENATLRLYEAANGPGGSVEVHGATYATIFESIIYSLQHRIVSDAVALLEEFD